MKLDTLISLGLLVVLSISLTFLVLEFPKYNSDGSRCMNQPFIFGASKISEKEENNVNCMCYVGNKQFSFTEENFEMTSTVYFTDLP
jgi:hypothetical protein